MWANQPPSRRERTDSHHNKEPGEKPPEINHPRARTLHEIIGIGGAAAYPIWQRCDHIGRNDEEGLVALKQRRRKDDEKEADG